MNLLTRRIRTAIRGAIGRRVDRLVPVGLAALASLAGTAIAQESTGGGTSEPTTIKVLEPEARRPVGGFADAMALLNALETADRDLRALSAEIRYSKEFALAGDTQVRLGSLWFEDRSTAARQGSKDAAGEAGARARRFSILFRQLLVGTRMEEREQIYNFDGEWLVERFPAEKRLVKRQVVRPGERFDPLKIGEGPLPIPIGQRRDDILARYDATLLEPGEGLDDLAPEQEKELRTFVAGSVQLLLVPRAEFADRDDFREIRLWYRRAEGADAKTGTLLPRMARTINRSDDRALVQLIRVKINDEAKIAPGVFDTSTPVGWDVTIQPFRGSLESEPGEAGSEDPVTGGPGGATGTDSPAAPASAAPRSGGAGAPGPVGPNSSPASSPASRPPERRP